MKIKNTILGLSLLMFVSVVNGQNTVGNTINTVDATEGYVLFSSMSETETYLIDNCGRVVNQWNSNYKPGLSCYLLDDGSLLRCGQTLSTTFNAGGKGGIVEKFDWDGNLVWEYTYDTPLYRQHHDIELLPNGNVLILAFELKNLAECLDEGRDPNLLQDNELWPEHIIEVMPIGSDSGEIVWEWHMWDHLIQDFDSTKANFGVVAEHPELFNINYTGNNTVGDWAHANSIDYNPILDQIVISLNKFDEIVIIDHSTTTQEAASHSGGNSGKGGDLLYRYGNQATYNHGDVADKTNHKQHDVTWINEGFPDGGKLIFYHNGTNRPTGSYSSIDIVEPLVDSLGNYVLEGDTTFGPDVPDWSYTAANPTDFYSPNISGVQRLENGHTLICEGRSGRIFEIDENENIVWEYVNPIYNSGTSNQGDPATGNRSTFRALRYLPSYAAFVGKDLTPGNMIEGNPSMVNCIETGVSELENKAFQLYPNPVNSQLSVITDSKDQRFVLDITGKQVASFEGNVQVLDLSGLVSGIYFLKIGGKVRKFVKA